MPWSKRWLRRRKWAWRQVGAGFVDLRPSVLEVIRSDWTSTCHQAAGRSCWRVGHQELLIEAGHRRTIYRQDPVPVRKLWP